MRHWIRDETAWSRSLGLTPRGSFHGSVYGRSLKHGSLEHGTFVRWPLRLYAFHWWALEWWHYFHWVLVNWWTLHAAIARIPRTAAPFQLRHSFMCDLVDWFVHQSIPGRKRQTYSLTLSSPGLSLKLLSKSFFKLFKP